jgi:hypothetical protein
MASISRYLVIEAFHSPCSLAKFSSATCRLESHGIATGSPLPRGAAEIRRLRKSSDGIFTLVS